MAVLSGRRGGALPKVLGGLLGVVLVLGIGAWFFRDQLSRIWGGEEEVATVVSPAAAAQAEEKLTRLREEGDTVRLSEVEFTSLLRYRMGDRLPGDLEEPTVLFRGDTVRFKGRVPSDRLPETPELVQIRPFLPDTADVDITGQLRTLGPGRSALDIRRITFAQIPIPDRLYPRALERMGRRDEPGLPPSAFPFHLPEGVGAARVEGGFLILSPD